ncbi:UDP-N-acetylmuramoyl-tripeptide--D-alanyl-D-alanine ligase [Macrococcoides caseolyticum]|uniref:UDP-N-acetylmuramoyl-tripeptide--D-alanyl-D- alanine ligase n=1 Tax=Macrococcoides caseolyticum TaxID=69966 RepID=UPI001F15B71B|nr:UDP-N-acetylmuramoyl-tripeptide--D-alanyl-D-alanine ligase [Macrococcus caseolyticus]MCE4957617.1 UDP-N-acetylmuramoyl-tripeptide--D-alanyl-D-alanine ligase [Macrococcus caseolyticus]
MIKRSLQWIAEQTNGTLIGNNQEVIIEGVSIDSRHINEGVLFIPFKGENVDGHHYVKQALESGAHAALWQSDVEVPQELPLVVVEDTLIALQSIAKAYLNEVHPKVIAITGSNGKTTTKDMVEAVLAPNFKVKKTQGNYNNEIGLPLTLCQLDEDTEISILEMGMSGFGEIEFLSELAQPDIAAITNIGESHMRDLGSRAGIAQAKFEIIKGLNGPLFYDGDEPLLQALVAKSEGTFKKIGFNEDNDYYIHALQTSDRRITFKVDDYTFSVPTLGAHNARNATIAIAIGRLLGLSDETICSNLNQLQLTNMRMEQMIGQNKSRLINDAYNASPTSMRAAIDTLSIIDIQKKIIVFSDVLELGPDSKAYHTAIGEYFKDKGIDMLMTVGQDAFYIAEAARPFTNATHYDSKEALEQALVKELNPNTVVLFKASRGMALETIINHLI